MLTSLISATAVTMPAAVAAAIPGAMPINLSIQHLVLEADPVVKVILALLVIFSIWCWTIVIEKMIEITRAKNAAQHLERTLKSGNLDDMINYHDQHSLAKVIAAGSEEWRSGSGEHAHEALHEVRDRVERAMRLQLSAELRRLNNRLSFLATVGSAAPFIGLFGTVWGIMTTFVGIGTSHDTSLATVAPGIAEALIATAIGLVAAIPAVMAYNKFANEINRYSGRVSTVIGVYAGRLAKRRVISAS